MHIICQKAALLPQDGTVTTLYVFMLTVRAITHFLSHPRSSSTRANRKTARTCRRSRIKITKYQFFKYLKQFKESFLTLSSSCTVVLFLLHF